MTFIIMSKLEGLTPQEKMDVLLGIPNQKADLRYCLLNGVYNERNLEDTYPKELIEEVKKEIDSAKNRAIIEREE